MKIPKTFIICLICICLWTACDNNGSKTINTTQPEVQKIATSDMPDFEGFWVNNRYLEELKKTMSPSKASTKAEIVAVSIKEDSVNQFSAGLVFNWHEGNSYKLQKADGQKYQLNDMLDSSKAFDIVYQNGSVVLNDSMGFTRMGKSSDGENGLIEYIIGGTYKLKGTDEIVTFKEGKITGLKTYNFYSILLDYITEQGTVYDQIILSAKENEPNRYVGFQIKGSQLTIFELKCKNPKEDPCMNYNRGKVMYELIKQP